VRRTIAWVVLGLVDLHRRPQPVKVAFLEAVECRLEVAAYSSHSLPRCLHFSLLREGRDGTVEVVVEPVIGQQQAQQWVVALGKSQAFVETVRGQVERKVHEVVEAIFLGVEQEYKVALRLRLVQVEALVM